MINIFLEGNNGGDYIRIKQYKRQEKDNTCFVEVGCCCVVILKNQIPIELITNLFFKAMLEANGDIKKMIEQTMQGYMNEFKQERVSRLEEWVKRRNDK